MNALAQPVAEALPATDRARQIHNMWLDYLVLRGDGDPSAPEAFSGFVRALHTATVDECAAFLTMIGAGT